MKDTTPEIEAVFFKMMQRKSPEQRLQMACSMHDFAKELVKHKILEDSPNISNAQLRQRLFLRFYGNDFGPVQKEKILAHLAMPIRIASIES